jgi:mono/diheme cytochrome c family protein
VRTVDTPAIHRLGVPGVGVSNTPGGRGRAVYMGYCEACHGSATERGIQSYDGAGVIDIKTLGAERVVTAIRSGLGPMPAHTAEMINDEQMEWLLTYLNNPASAGGRGGGAVGVDRRI